MIRPSLLAGAFWLCLALVLLDVARRLATGVPAMLDAMQLPFVVLALGAAGLKVKWGKDGFEVSSESKERAKQRLSAAEKKRGDSPKNANGSKIIEELSRHKMARILWVDDHAENNVEELQVLTELGFNVTAVPSTAAATLILKDGAIDLVISDMDRDGVRDEGVSFVSALRKENITVPVVIYRGQQDELSDKARAAGALDVVVSPSDLLRAIRKVVGG